MRRICLLLIAAAAAWYVPAVQAADYETWLQAPLAVRDQTPGNWKANLGLGYGSAPKYRGARSATGFVLPVIDTEWRGRVFISTVRGVGINWVHTSDTLFGPRITYDAGRKESLDASLAGTGDIKSGYEAGLFFVHFSGPWRFDSDIRQRVTSGPKAVRATLGATIGGPIAANANLFFGGRVEYDGSKYNEAYYLDAGAGITNVITYMAVVRELGGGTYLGFDGQVGRLLGPASKNPLTRNTLYFAGITTGHRF